MLEKGPTVQHLIRHTRGIALQKHPERPLQHVDFGRYLRDAPAGPKGDAIKPRKGERILFFTLTRIRTRLRFTGRCAGRPNERPRPSAVFWFAGEFSSQP